MSSEITQEKIEDAFCKEDKAYFFHTAKFYYMLVFHETSMYQKNMAPCYLTRRSVRRRPLFVARSDLQAQER